MHDWALNTSLQWHLALASYSLQQYSWLYGLIKETSLKLFKICYISWVLCSDKNWFKASWSKEAVVRRCYGKKLFFKISQDSQENGMPEACNFIKKETLEQVLSCKFCEIFRYTFSIEHLRLLLLKLWLYFYHSNLTMWPPFLHPSKKTFLSLLIWPRSEYTWTLNSKQSLLIHFEIWCSLFSRVGIGWWTLL